MADARFLRHLRLGRCGRESAAAHGVAVCRPGGAAGAGGARGAAAGGS